MNRLKKILIVVAVLLVLGALAGYIRHRQLRGAVESYLAELKAKGEPMDLGQILPPTLPPEQNSADTLLQAMALLKSSTNTPGVAPLTNQIDGMVMVAPGKAMIGCQQPRIGEEGGESSWEDVTASVAQNAKAFGLLHQIIAKPDFDFLIHYEQGAYGIAFANLHLVELRQAVLSLQIAALCSLHRGDNSCAVLDLRAILAMVKAMRDERLVISELVRIGIAQFAIEVTWEVLQAPGLTDQQLGDIQQDWGGLEFSGGEERAVTMERVTWQISLAEARASSAAMQAFRAAGKNAHRIFSPSKPDEGPMAAIQTAAGVLAWRYWLSYADELHTLQSDQILLDTIRQARTNGVYKAALDASELRLNALGISKLSREFESIFNRTRGVMAAKVSKEIVVTAIALRRYQFKYGKDPSELGSLVPEFLAKLPMDPVDGRPLRYRLKSDGTFLLYSVGENGVDDGGNPGLDNTTRENTVGWQNRHALDWVWPQPATKAEVEEFLKARPPWPR